MARLVNQYVTNKCALTDLDSWTSATFVVKIVDAEGLLRKEDTR